ncbi:hypothetical protein KC571_01665, partial [candidate division WWE3 bacterium]|nr:hypothetical protein [candidate division WWE3 bacterium]
MTLTEAANTFRTTIKFGWLIIFLPLVVKIILTIMNSASAPDPGAQPPPVFDAAFGKLPAVVISNVDVQTTTPQFNLD